MAGRELPATGPRRSGRWAAADGGGARQDGEEGHGGGGLWAALADTGGWGAVARRAWEVSLLAVWATLLN